MPPTKPDWGPLYLAHRRPMYLVALSILRRSDLAEDAVQNAMESLMKNPPADVVNWEAMMVNAAKLRALDIVGSAPERHHGGSLAPELQPESGDQTPGEAVEAIDLLRRVQKLEKAMDVLTDREGQVLVRRVLREESRDAVAADLGVSPARVSQIVTAALSKLREALVDEDAA
ncbi:sigma-70 family RNA polymerase sigma factor [Cryobacterium fucosi]|uniref:Sigma-70 family RNA polymerase sigma factor n=1 Tax=Cryobacterium fucosi TaxID=1259157 RepID=A0A4R9BAB4_9MICO|nr:sigma-70 family RNA polymerase sigma factor [Cryobacterium fucosi]TFD79413.1 sigma-70 family RNA polymerase sigma factor [Cryobacterium fucosi]